MKITAELPEKIWLTQTIQAEIEADRMSYEVQITGFYVINGIVFFEGKTDEKTVFFSFLRGELVNIFVCPPNSDLLDINNDGVTLARANRLPNALTYIATSSLLYAA